METEAIFIKIPPELAGERLDAALSKLIKTHSRAKIQQAIKNGALVNGKAMKTKERVYGGESVELYLESSNDPMEDALPENLNLEIVYEDQDIAVLNKPSNMVVHPGAGNPTGTLMNGLLHCFPKSRELPRAGIVHRLDKNTSGIMVVAKTYEAYLHLCQQLVTRDMGRMYHAICNGVLISGQTINEPIARHSKDRLRMAVQPLGKEAITHINVLERFREHTHIACQLETGRTHQIRVHLSHIHHPLFGDDLYGGRFRLIKGLSTEHIENLRNFQRQALHAKKLSLIHPTRLERMDFETELPDDFKQLLRTLTDDFLAYEQKQNT